MNYLRAYEALIRNARAANRQQKDEFNYHNHHIFPLCWCIGLLTYLKQDNRNLVLLTPREHFVAHHLLAKTFGGKMWFASWRMCHSCHTNDNYNGLITARIYESINFEQAKVTSSKIVTNETKHKQSISVTEWWQNMDTITKKIRNNKISESRIEMLKHRDKITSKEIIEKVRKTLQENPCKRRTCSINGIEYFSLSEAGRKLHIHVDTLRNRINSKNYPEYINGVLYVQS